MNETELRATILRLLQDVVPEMDPATVQPDVDIRDQLDIDSMDFLHFLLAVDKELHVDVPEADYGKLNTLDKCAAYLMARMPAAPPAVAAAPAAHIEPAAADAPHRDGTYPDLHRRLQRLVRDLDKSLPGPLAAYGELHKQAVAEGALSKKAKELMALSIAIAVHCNGCIAYHVHDALRAGASHQEVIETIGVAIMMGGGPAEVYGAEAYDALIQFQAVGVGR